MITNVSIHKLLYSSRISMVENKKKGFILKSAAARKIPNNNDKKIYLSNLR